MQSANASLDCDNAGNKNTNGSERDQSGNSETNNGKNPPSESVTSNETSLSSVTVSTGGGRSFFPVDSTDDCNSFNSSKQSGTISIEESDENATDSTYVGQSDIRKDSSRRPSPAASSEPALTQRTLTMLQNSLSGQTMHSNSNYGDFPYTHKEMHSNVPYATDVEAQSLNAAVPMKVMIMGHSTVLLTPVYEVDHASILQMCTQSNSGTQKLLVRLQTDSSTTVAPIPSYTPYQFSPSVPTTIINPKHIYRTSGDSFRIQMSAGSKSKPNRKFSRNVRGETDALILCEYALILLDKPTSFTDILSNGNFKCFLQRKIATSVEQFGNLLHERLPEFEKRDLLKQQEYEAIASLLQRSVPYVYLSEPQGPPLNQHPAVGGYKSNEARNDARGRVLGQSLQQHGGQHINSHISPHASFSHPSAQRQAQQVLSQHPHSAPTNAYAPSGQFLANPPQSIPQFIYGRQSMHMQSQAYTLPTPANVGRSGTSYPGYGLPIPPSTAAITTNLTTSWDTLMSQDGQTGPSNKRRRRSTRDNSQYSNSTLNSSAEGIGPENNHATITQGRSSPQQSLKEHSLIPSFVPFHGDAGSSEDFFSSSLALALRGDSEYSGSVLQVSSGNRSNKLPMLHPATAMSSAPNPMGAIFSMHGDAYDNSMSHIPNGDEI
mmetsp:Transcript_14489/g.21815  ORF Transcript_14489/g.21815 Transcript_14489/m.21815 type:complete len:661 (-) Transcript_14489:529-2511(-)